MTENEMYYAGQNAWPEVELEREHFSEHVARITDNRGRQPDPQFASDLYLACACSHANATAIALFESSYLKQALGKVRQIDNSPSFVDEAQQQTRFRLLVASSGELPRIAEYAGHGSLLGWVRVVTVRVAINLNAKHAKETELVSGAHDEINLTPANVELAYLKQRYAKEFSKAMTEACRTLSARDRTLLRLRFVDALSIDEMGALYSVHRATAARWLVTARERVFENVHRQLEVSLQSSLSPQEFESVVGLVRSQLDVSISSLLQSQTSTS